jgi:hypothetical protein
MDTEFRGRVSVVAWAVVAATAVSLVVRLPAVFVVNFEALGSPISLQISDTTLMAAFLALLSASGAESAIRTHPRFCQRSGRWATWGYWALPAALSILAVVLIPQLPSRIAQVAGLLAHGGLMALALFSLYATVDQGTSGFRRGRVFLNVLAYASALALFLLVYQTRIRSLLSGSVVALTATLLAVELLRSTTQRRELILSYALIVGLVLGETTWALNYWTLPGLTGGLLLLLVFYLIVSLAQHALQGHLTRRVIVEFALFAIFALILIAVVGPGF